MMYRPTSAIHRAIVAAIVAWALSCGSTGVAQDGIVTASYFFIRNHGNPKLFLHNRGGEPVASPIAPPECPGGQWALEPVLGDTTVRIRHRAQNVYLHMQNGQLELGAMRSDWIAARWFIEADERRLVVRIRNAQSGLYLALHEIPGPLTAMPIDPVRDPSLLEWDLIEGVDCLVVPLVTAPVLRPQIVLPGRLSPIRVPVLQPPPATFPPGQLPPPGQMPPLKPPPTNGAKPPPGKLPPLQPPPNRFPRPDAPPPPDGGEPPPNKFPRPDAPLPPEEAKPPPDRIPRRPPPRPKRQIPELPELVDTPPKQRTPRGPTIRGGLTFDGSPAAKRPIVKRAPIVKRPATARPKSAPRPRVIPPRRSPRAR